MFTRFPMKGLTYRGHDADVVEQDPLYIPKKPNPFKGGAKGKNKPSGK